MSKATLSGFTGEQLIQVLNLVSQKKVPKQALQKLFSSGILSTVLELTPREIEKIDIEELRYFLELPEVYDVFVDPYISIETLLQETNNIWQWVDEHFTSGYFPALSVIHPSLVKNYQLHLVKANTLHYWGDSWRLFSLEIEELGLVWGDIFDLLFLLKKNPKLADKYIIPVFGSRIIFNEEQKAYWGNKRFADRVLYPVVNGAEGGQRGLFLYPYEMIIELSKNHWREVRILTYKRTA